MPSTKTTFHHGSSKTYFRVFSQNGKYFQRRWQIGYDGGEENVDEKEINYVLGSGNHARTYLHLTARNTLQELPLGWYAEKGGYWGLNPGYDRPDGPGSAREVDYDCMSCHNGYPKVSEKPASLLTEVEFIPRVPEGIDCQRCHGPARKHVDAAFAGAPLDQIRGAIVNPKRLSPSREFEVCLQCHLETTSSKLPHSIRRFGQRPFSYIPGKPLGDYTVAFDRAEGMRDGFEIAQGAYRLRMSQCFLKSLDAQGDPRLRCTTCHDPHNIPRGAEAAAHYNSVCLSCHSSSLARITPPSAHSASSNCVSCHMPKRRTDDAVHVVMTDHFIARNRPAGDLLAEKPEPIESPAMAYHGEVVPYYPAHLSNSLEDQLVIALAQVSDQTNPQGGLSRLKDLIDRNHPKDAIFYGDLGEAYLSSGDAEASIPYFEEAARRDPSAFRHFELANALMEVRRWPEAENGLLSTVAQEPSDPQIWTKLGWAQWQQNKAAEAKVSLQKAISLNGEIPELHNILGLVLWGTGDPKGSVEEFREALRIRPGIAEWRLNLARALASQNRAQEALYQFRESVRLKPDFAVAHAGYGHLLASQGDLSGAVRELTEATQLRQDLWRAHYELGMALEKRGNIKSAMDELTIAAGGFDPSVRAEANQALSKMRQPTARR